MKNSLLLLSLMVLMVGPLSSQAHKRETSGQQRYTFPADGFAIIAPSKPDIHPDADAPDVRVYRWNLAADTQLAIHLGVRPDCSRKISELKDKFTSGKDKAGSESVTGLTLDGRAGLEYRATSPTHEIVERLYCDGERAYTLTGYWPLRHPEPLSIQRLLNSFHLLNDHQGH